jgi:uncharacterized membrane protein
MLLLESSFSLFFGRFHPVFVHLPIGFLLLAVIMEFVSFNKISEKMDNAILFSFKLGCLSAFLAAAMGWFLAGQGGYNESDLFWHKWLGIGVGVIAFLAILVKSEFISLSNTAYKIMLTTLTAFLVITGHLGGNMTHGPTYLTEYAPAPIAALLGHASENETKRALNDPDSILVYKDIIRPMFEKRCFECHSDSKSSGDLQMHTQEGLLKGGDSGPIIVNGKATDSELYKRITKDPTSKKFMPTDGKMHLGFEDVQLIAWWINDGASFEKTVSDAEFPKNIKRILENNHGVSLVKKSFVEVMKVDAAAENDITELKNLGFTCTPLANGNNFLDIRYNKLGATPSSSDLEQLLKVKEQLTWLNLANMKITDEMLTVIAQMPNLSRLQIQNNSITDKGLQALESLNKLESLNLYGTEVSDAGLKSIEKLPQLRKLYLWQSKVSPEGAEKLQTKRPRLYIEMGTSLASTADTVEEES